MRWRSARRHLFTTSVARSCPFRLSVNSPVPPPPSPRPNILLILADQWRADCLGFDGHPAVETPHLDHLFYHGIHFRQAYASVPTCVAARCSIMTGLTPRSHGRVGYADDVPWTYRDTLPRLLTRSGYQTCCVGKLHVTPERNRIGFEEVILHDGWLAKHRADRHPDTFCDYQRYLRQHAHPQAEVSDTGLHVNSWVTAPWPYAEHLHPTNWAVSEAVQFLRRRDPTVPFFLNVSLVRPHPPFDPPAQYLDFYRDKALPPVPIGSWRAANQDRGGLKYDWTRGAVAPDQLDRARRAYYALITHADHQLNRLNIALEEHDLLDNTIIMFVSDHGELLGDHHYHGKALPFDGSARVPWLMRFPKTWGIRGRQVFDTPIELRDILPTLCDCAGVAIPPAVEGRSVLPLVRGEGWQGRPYIEGEHVRSEDESNQWLTDGRMKYIWFTESGRELLFDLQNDPQELDDLSQKNPAETTRWRERLIRQIEGYEEGFVRDGALVPGRTTYPVLHHLRQSSHK